MKTSVDYAAAVGQRFGQWTVLDIRPAGGRMRYLARCSCGVEADVAAWSILLGRSTRCNACARPHRGRTTHGATVQGTVTPEWNCWRAMRERCSNPKHRGWKRYGGRGITVHPSWESFETFLRDVGPRPSLRHSLDRYPNPNGNYEPGNVRWATHEEQARNRSSTRLLTVDGLTLCVEDWARRVGMSPSTLYDRLRRGWDPARAVMELVR